MSTPEGTARSRRESRRDWLVTLGAFIGALALLGCAVAGLGLEVQIRHTQHSGQTILREVEKAVAQQTVGARQRQQVLSDVEGLVRNLDSQEAAGEVTERQLITVIAWVECRLNVIGTSAVNTCGAPPAA